MAQDLQKEQIQNLIALLRADVLGKPLTLVAPLNAQVVYALARRHMVVASIADAACTQPIAEEEKAHFQKQKMRVLQRQALFDAEKLRLFAAFDQQGLDYLPIKGEHLCKLYPRYGMREFSDCDVLVRNPNFAVIDKIFKESGYEKEKSSYSVHVAYQKPPIFNFEIHRRLFAQGMKNFEYFATAFDRAHLVDGEGAQAQTTAQPQTAERPQTPAHREYAMTQEDLYVYVVSHLFKHDRSGFGFRGYLDFYLLKRDCEEKGYDRATVQKLLDQMGVAEFEAQMTALSEQMFGGDEISLSDEDLFAIASFGAYGTVEASVQKHMRTSNKNYVLSKLFPPIDELAIMYPVLYKVPVLYPFVIVWRFFKVVFNPASRKNALARLRAYQKEKSKK